MKRIVLDIFLNLVWVGVSEWVSEWESEWQGLVNDFLCTLTLREFWVLLNAKNIWGSGGCTHPPPGISGSTYAMKLKLTPGMALIKRSWLITLSTMSLVSCVFYRPKTILADISKKIADDVINQLLLSRRLPRVSFKLIACLEPVKQDDHYFHAEILVCKFHLESRKACLRMRRRLYYQTLLCQSIPKEIFFPGSYLKKTSKGGIGGSVHLPPKKREALRRLWIHVLHLEFSSTLNSSSCTHGCFVPLILYLI